MELTIREGTINDIKEMDALMYEGDEHHRVNLPHKFRKSDESREEFVIHAPCDVKPFPQDKH